MAEKSFFFNAFPDPTNPTGYDRNYNGDDLSDWYSFVFENGVVKTGLENDIPTGLKVVENGAMIISVNAGRACIKGKGYLNTSLKTFVVDTSSAVDDRYDYVVLRYDNRQVSNARQITCELVRGTSSKPTIDDLTRNDNVYELMLAYIHIKAGVDQIVQDDIVDTRDLIDNLDRKYCGWFTAVKGYEDYYDAIIQRHESVITLETNKQYIVSTIPSKLYNSKYSLVSVYTNGIKENESAYTTTLLSTGFLRVNFEVAKQSGSVITIVLENFIDGEGMTTALTDYLNWKEAVAKLEEANEYTYVCNGTNDNVLIGNIVRAYLEGGSDYGTAKIKVIGNIGMSAPAYGSGTTANPYAWFNFNIESNRNVIVDFSSCGQIAPTITDGTYNNIFHSNNDIHIIGANVVVSNSNVNTIIRVINTTSGVVIFEKCRFYITAYKDSLIALRGTFINCRGSVANVINNSYCFLPSSNSVVRLIGGEYYAYTGDNSYQSAVIGQSGAEAVSILYGVSAPTSARSGFYQTNSIIQYAGGGMINCTDLISELPLVVVSGISNIRGTIEKSKTNVM